VYLTPPPNFNDSIEIVACYFEHEGQILLLHRQNQGVADPNMWGIPGGKKKKNETIQEAIIREVEEETQFDISDKPIEYLGKVYIRDPKKDYVYHMFRSPYDKKPGKVVISFKEHKGFTWINPIEALQMNLMPDEGDCFKLVYGDYPPQLEK
jgi:8-oxo-dGTP pyrophosphatase MutT (NUDIX family)